MSNVLGGRQLKMAMATATVPEPDLMPQSRNRKSAVGDWEEKEEARTKLLPSLIYLPLGSVDLFSLPKKFPCSFCAKLMMERRVSEGKVGRLGTQRECERHGHRPRPTCG